MTPLDYVKQHLTNRVRMELTTMQMGGRKSHYNFVGAADFVLDQGTSFSSEPLTEEETAIVLRASDFCPVGRFQPRQCFYNAQMLMGGNMLEENPTLEYWERYCLRSGIPFLHGWCVLNGKVIDLTLRTPNNNHKGRLRNAIFGAFPESYCYFGVRFSMEDIRERVVETHLVGTLLDCYEMDYPYMRRNERKSPQTLEAFSMPNHSLGAF